MSESNTTCPHCERKPGGVHRMACPRSRETLRQIASAMRVAGAPTLFWDKIAFNPKKKRYCGVTYLNNS
jgi:hypothetical protein